jgi:replicative DNA helicase
MWDLLGELMDPSAETPGIPTGFPDLDQILPTMKAGQMTTIAARSGVGKSTLGVDLLRNAAYRHGRKVLMISIEMPDRQVVSRILAAESRIQHHIIEKNLPRSTEEERREQEAAARIGNGPLVVVNMVQPTVADIRAVVRQEKPDIVLVDYLGRMSIPKADRHDLSLTMVVDGLSNIGKAEQCHMIVLSQLNRKGDARNDKRPVIGDLRDTAALEHYSDVVLLLHRPDLHDPDDRPGEVDVVVAKNREGKNGVVVPLAAQLHYSRFTSMAHGTQPTPSDPVVDITEPTRHVDTYA